MTPNSTCSSDLESEGSCTTIKDPDWTCPRTSRRESGVKRMVDDPRPFDAISRCEVRDDDARIERNDLIRTGLMAVSCGVGTSWKSLVSYRSDTARYRPSCDIADEIRFVRS
jgi:hypothetical protein